ncbi:MAG: ParA family protein, partial [Acidobacteriota bacterium]
FEMRKIAVSISKGGTGKSTTAANLAAGLSLEGFKVLLIDTDTQGQIANMLGRQPDYGLAEVIIGEINLEKAIVKSRENLWLLAGGRALAGVKSFIGRKEFGGERTLLEALSPTDQAYDYVILDTSPGWDTLTINVLFYAQEVLVPVSLEILAIQGLLDFHKSVEAIQKYNTDLKIKYVLPTFLDGRVKKSSEILDQLNDYYKPQLCTPIRYNVRLSEAPGYKQTIYEYAPTSPGAIDYKKLVERIANNGRP